MDLSQRRRALLVRLRKRKTRAREGLVLVEGVRAVSEALAAGARARFALVCDQLLGEDTNAKALVRGWPETLPVHRVDEDTFRGASDTEQPQGVLVVCEEPSWNLGSVRPGGRYLLLDAVQDPGNVGTLVRAAVAFGLDGVLVMDGTADPWSPKAVRASAGVVFRVPVLTGHADSILATLGDVGVPVLVADATGADVAAGRSDGTGWALAIGNEGAGQRESVRAAASETVSVPMRGPAESLNAAMAGSILLYALSLEIVRG